MNKHLLRGCVESILEACADRLTETGHWNLKKHRIHGSSMKNLVATHDARFKMSSDVIARFWSVPILKILLVIYL